MRVHARGQAGALGLRLQPVAQLVGGQARAAAADKERRLLRVGEVAADLVAQIKANTQLLTALGADSVPYMVLRTAAEGPYTVVPGGLPTAELAKLLGL